MIPSPKKGYRFYNTSHHTPHGYYCSTIFKPQDSYKQQKNGKHIYITSKTYTYGALMIFPLFHFNCQQNTVMQFCHILTNSTFLETQSNKSVSLRLLIHFYYLNLLVKCLYSLDKLVFNFFSIWWTKPKNNKKVVSFKPKMVKIKNKKITSFPFMFLFWFPRHHKTHMTVKTVDETRYEPHQFQFVIHIHIKYDLIPNQPKPN